MGTYDMNVLTTNAVLSFLGKKVQNKILALTVSGVTKLI